MLDKAIISMVMGEEDVGMSGINIKKSYLQRWDTQHHCLLREIYICMASLIHRYKNKGQASVVLCPVCVPVVTLYFQNAQKSRYHDSYPNARVPLWLKPAPLMAAEGYVL